LQFKEINENALPDIDHSRMSDDEIAKYSLLNINQGTSMPSIVPMYRNILGNDVEGALKIAGNFIGGGLITGGCGVKKTLFGNETLSLEGFLAQPNFEVWGWLIDD